jgi:selenocysteine lyase/cysteine desulfurase
VRRPDFLRRQFPVFEQFAYLNAGTCGPLPAQALRAGADEALGAAETGRTAAYFERTRTLSESLRARYARVIGAHQQDVALTLSTSDGLVRVLTGLRLQPGDEVLTSEFEHPGLLGPLAQAQRLLGIRVRTAPLADLADAVSADTRLVACSHVSWVDGALAPAALAQLDIPVLLDGAQGAGAIPVDVAALGCCAYAASGQKWLCGPIGHGLLWIAPQWRERIPPLAPTLVNLAAPNDGLDAAPWEDARAYDSGTFSTQTLAAADAAVAVFEETGWPEVFERAAMLAETLAQMLRDGGRVVLPRARTTLVSFEDDTPADTVSRLAEAGVVVRALPNTRYVRASVGAWNDENDLERLVALV